MFTTKITSNNAPSAIGPYSPGIQLSDFIYLSGQLPIDAKTMEIVSLDIKDQTKKVLENICALLSEKGLSTRHIVKTTVFMTDLKEFDEMNKVYGEFFEDPYPARSCVQVAALPKNAKIEIECLVIDTLKYEEYSEDCSCCGGNCGEDCDC